MKAEAWIFAVCTIFLVLVTPAYWFITEAEQGAREGGGDWTGTSALVMTALARPRERRVKGTEECS